MTVYLASQSPRRRELLNQIGVPHKTIKVSVDESHLPDESPEHYVKRLAYAKANAGRLLCPNHPVLGADTTVVLGDTLLGKPEGRAQGIEMLLELSGRQHRVLTGVALADDQVYYRLSESLVRFRMISEAEAQAYWETGEPADKAGGYAVQGKGAVFIEHISGSYSGIMGLPVFETAQVLELAGIKSMGSV